MTIKVLVIGEKPSQVKKIADGLLKELNNALILHRDLLVVCEFL